jgi:tungstate transport system substrate-binding protein
VILVNPDNHPHVNVAAATIFIDWLTADDGRSAIASYRMNGEQLFAPAPGPGN